MKVHGLMFKGPLVRAMLRIEPHTWPPKRSKTIEPEMPIKWQTRRPVTRQPMVASHIKTDRRWAWSESDSAGVIVGELEAIQHRVKKTSPFKPGDIVKVRETFIPGRNKTYFRADIIDPIEAAGFGGLYGGWHPAVHMPHDLCRLEFEIMKVEVDVAFNITGADAEAEGIDLRPELWPNINRETKAIARFLSLWRTIYKKLAIKHRRAPEELWVYALHMKRIK